MKILLATDGSEFSFTAAKKCCEFLKKGAVVRILYVVEEIAPAEPFGMTDEYLAIVRQASRDVAEGVVEDTRQAMEAILGGAPQSGIETRTEFGRPKVKIVEEAEKWGADLVVVGSHGRGFWGRMFLGSVSDAVVRHAPCSVLVVRETGKKK